MTSASILFPSVTKKWNALHAAFHTAIDQTLPIALWRLPNVIYTDAIVDFSEIKHFSLDAFENNSVGFVFSRFLKKEPVDSIFIKAGVHLIINAKYEVKKSKNISSMIEDDKYTAFIKQYNQWSDKEGKKGDSFLSSNRRKINNEYSATKEEYCALVNAAINEITQNKLDKIVVSRIVYVSLPEDSNPVDIFIQLKTCYPSLFISLVSIPEKGVWIGASPEHLLTVKDDQLKIAALAGTQARENNNALRDIAWKEKEIREQALVSHYIRHFLQKQKCSWVEKGPHTISAGKIAHLQTDFFIVISQQNKFHLINEIMEELHPTSAICGMPKKKALAFIVSHENYNRDFYCGFLGPININEESHIFVNIRCMRLGEEEACLYAGTGITSDSIPENEWDETILKINTLLPFLFSKGVNHHFDHSVTAEKTPDKAKRERLDDSSERVKDC